MDRLTRKLVETVHQITEGAARGGAAIFADMTDTQFQDYISGNPGAEELARKLRAQGLAAREQSSSGSSSSTTPPPAPQPQSGSVRFPNVHEYTSSVYGRNNWGVEDRAIREIRGARGNDIHELVSHPSPEVRSWLAQHNQHLTPEHVFTLLNDPHREVRLAITDSGNLGFNREHMQHVFARAMSTTPDSVDTINEHPATSRQMLQNAMRKNPRFITPEMHQAMVSGPHADLAQFARTWSETHGTGYPNKAHEST